MKYHLIGYGVSALLHVVVLLATLPVLIWQDDLVKPNEQHDVNLSLAQFVPAPPVPKPEPAPPVQQEEPLAVPPVSKPGPKPVKKSKPEPVKKARPEKQHEVKPKPVKAPKPKAEKRITEHPKPAPRSNPVPQRQFQPVPQPAAATVPRQVAPAPKPAQTAQPSSNPAAEAAYKRKLQGLIATRKKYPRMAQKAEIEGSVLVAFTVMPNGAITGVRVRNSSGNDWLDKAAVQAVNAASGALPFPPEIRKPNWAFSLTVNFKLDW